jgi:hypothetical protein
MHDIMMQGLPLQHKKGAENQFSAPFGTPDQTLTGGLSLRRRPLYTTELPGHAYDIEFWEKVKRRKKH